MVDKTENKIVYAYTANGKLIGAVTLDYTDRSPISGNWQLPAGTTETEPSAAKDGCYIIWTGSAWEYKAPSATVETAAETTTATKTTTTADASYVDPTVLAIMEALAAQESRLAALESATTTTEGGTTA